MADIVQRGLNLQVQAEDLASATLLELADQLDALEARAQTAFSAIAMAGEDAASSLADSAQLFAPEWESQLEGLLQSADAVFTGIGELAITAADSLAGSATTVSDSWLTAMDSLKGSTDTALGSLDGLQGDMETTAGVADQTAGEIAAAYGGDALALDGGVGSLGSLQAEMEGTAGVAGSTAGEIATAYGGDALALDASKGSLATLRGEFNTTESVATADAAKITTAWDGKALGLDAGVSTLKDLQGGFTTTADDAEGAAKKIAGSFSNKTLKLDAGVTTLKDLQTQMDAAAATAEGDAKAISAAFAGAAATIGDTAAAAGTAGGEAGAATGAASGEVAGINFGQDAKGNRKPRKLPMPSLSGLMTGGITGAIGLGAVDLGISQLQGLEALKAQTGMNWSQTLTTAAAAKGVGLNTDQIQRLIQHLDTGIGRLTQANVAGATVEGKTVGFGYGRLGVDPTTLAAKIRSGSGTVNAAGLALKSLGLTPGEMTGLNAQQQLALIATKLDTIKNATLRTAVTQELFGRGGTESAVLLQKFTMATTEAQKNLPKGLAKDLQTTLGNGGKSMVDMQEQMFYLEVEMSASLMKMVPLISKVLGEASKHTSLLMEIALGAGAAGAIHKVAGATGVEGLLEKLLGKGAGKLVGKAGGSLAGKVGLGAAAAKFGPKVLGKAGKLGLDITPEMIGAEIAAGISGSSGIDLSNSTGNDTSTFAKAWQKLVAPHTGTGAHVKTTGFTQKDSIKALTQAANVFGINKAALLADSYAEAGLRPNALGKNVPGQGQAHGLLQFMPKTWAADTTKIFGKGGLPLADAMNPYIAAFVGSDMMKKGGIGTQKDNRAALADIIQRFENPGPAGAAGDMARGIPFLNAVGGDVSKAEAAAKRQNAARKKKTSKPKSDGKPGPGRHLMVMDDDTLGPGGLQGISDGLTPPGGAAGTAAAALSMTKPIDDGFSLLVTHAKAHGLELQTGINTNLLEIGQAALTHGKTFTKNVDDSMVLTQKAILAQHAPFKAAGVDTMKGLLEGMQEQKGPLLAEAHSIANEIETTIRAALKTKSPSEVTAEIGADLMAGMALGMRSGTGEAVAQATRSSLDVAGALSPTAPGGAGAVGGEQTIIVQLDSAEIGRMVSRYQHGAIKVIAKLP